MLLQCFAFLLEVGTARHPFLHSFNGKTTSPMGQSGGPAASSIIHACIAPSHIKLVELLRLKPVYDIGYPSKSLDHPQSHIAR